MGGRERRRCEVGRQRGGRDRAGGGSGDEADDGQGGEERGVHEKEAENVDANVHPHQQQLMQAAVDAFGDRLTHGDVVDE